MQAIANAETLGVASSEQESAIQEIKRLQSTADSGNNSNLKSSGIFLPSFPATSPSWISPRKQESKS